MDAQTTLDRIDRRILSALQADGRITNQALAEQVALSPSACLARVRRLERAGVIEGYHARLNPWSLGPRMVLFVEVWLEAHHPADRARFAAAMAAMPEVVEASQVSGAYDYLLKVVVPDMPAWTRLGEELLESDAGVEKLVTHVLMKKTKVFVGYPVDG